ncbi:hypothetical protein N7474_000324 [Penicillium riverlandense]|uniref:uncharacterized protein n=1 Tax=Penicillium riverlandense TaxID=1903569 RepID=UPI0025480B9C|nr:uncharacterized protein N7474_000324 [Penicillium riverlandense]KAJ5832013.1 hypothetical protein N7474_000324 [Penicillium riverlandense]
MHFELHMAAIWPLTLALLLVVYLLQRAQSNASLKHIPILKFNRYLPDLVNRLIYYPKAASLIYRGYKQYKDCAFRMLTADGEVVVLPVKYTEELRKLPPSTISSLDAQYENALGDFTNILINSALPSATVRKRLTPSIGRITPWVLDELRYAFDTVLPECEDDWVPVQAHEMFVQLIACATSRVIGGEALRRNEKWLDTASRYSVNVGITVFLLRPFPTWLRPLIAPFLPCVREMKEQLRFVKNDLFVPMIRERRAAEQANDPAYVKPDDFLQWMMEMAEEEEDRDPDLLAHHLLILMSLAVVHTSSMAMCQALYDLVLMPEYRAPLRDEITRTLKDGWQNATQTSFLAQRRMDSFLRESQRFNPPGELSFHRIVKETLTLSDGLVLPRGTHICFAAGPLSKDAIYLSNPDIFDGLRWCQDPEDRYALMSDPSEKQLHVLNGSTTGPSSASPSFVTISPASMHFGFGRQACPGRFFAVNTIKAIMSRIISEYDFKFENRQAGRRPPNILVGEHIIPNTSTNVLFRKRSIGL